MTAFVKHQTTDYETFCVTTNAWLRHLKNMYGHDTNAPAVSEQLPFSNARYDSTLIGTMDAIMFAEGSFEDEVPVWEVRRVGYDAGPGWKIFTAFRRMEESRSKYDYVTIVMFSDDDEALMFKLAKP